MPDTTESNTPLDVADRAAFADKAEALLRLILSTLGYRAEVSLPDLLAGVAAWIAIVKLATRDPDGRLASIWWRAYDNALGRCPLAHDPSRREWAEEAADYATEAFLRRFPPLLEDADERDTIEDLDALRAELDRQTEVAAEAVTKAERLEAVAKAAENRAEAAEGAVENMYRMMQAGGFDGGGFAADIAVAKYGEFVRRRTHGAALVPLPKPERVELGQRWAYIQTIKKIDNGDVLLGPDWHESKYLSGSDYAYFGTSPASETT